MPVVEYAGQRVELNEEGFLVRSAEWTPEVAEAIAQEVDLAPLSPEHWKVLTFCRQDGVTPRLQWRAECLARRPREEQPKAVHRVPPRREGAWAGS